MHAGMHPHVLCVCVYSIRIVFSPLQCLRAITYFTIFKKFKKKEFSFCAICQVERINWWLQNLSSLYFLVYHKQPYQILNIFFISVYYSEFVLTVQFHLWPFKITPFHFAWYCLMHFPVHHLFYSLEKQAKQKQWISVRSQVLTEGVTDCFIKFDVLT